MSVIGGFVASLYVNRNSRVSYGDYDFFGPLVGGACVILGIAIAVSLIVGRVTS